MALPILRFWISKAELHVNHLIQNPLAYLARGFFCAVSNEH